ncbi:hypothetical protein B0H10DRAFT_2166460 [Mycena sp. CBHHK59/15]|nr:hypothetical protein B0H10DRAFT_2166460 [Mycena sp. CBHHK59/15]
MILSLKSTAFALLAVVVTNARAETHTVTFNNNCGFGTPMLIQGANVLSTGGGGCGFNGEGCTMVETTLRNPPSPGAGSSTDLTLIYPHAFSVTTGFGYYNGCNGAGADCTSSSCSTAFHSSGDTTVQVACQANDVDLVVCLL